MCASAIGPLPIQGFESVCAGGGRKGTHLQCDTSTLVDTHAGGVNLDVKGVYLYGCEVARLSGNAVM
eukprot:5148528-Pyramimonas_sp.AAC.2